MHTEGKELAGCSCRIFHICGRPNGKCGRRTPEEQVQFQQDCDEGEILKASIEAAARDKFLLQNIPVEILGEGLRLRRLAMNMVETGWHPASEPPENDKKVIVHVPEFEKRPDFDPVVFGRYSRELDEWRVEGSPSEWEVDWWTEVPRPCGLRKDRDEVSRDKV